MKPHRVPVLVALFSSLCLVPDGRLAVVRADEPGVKLTAAELERRLDAAARLTFGDARHTLPAPPWTADRLDGFAARALPAAQDVLSGKVSPTLEQRLHGTTVSLARVRLGLLAENPPRDKRDDLLAWLDTWITFYQILTLDLSHCLDAARQHVEYKRTHLLELDEPEDRELAGLLRALETLAREHEAFSRLSVLLAHQAKPLPPAEQEQVRTWLKDVRDRLPAARRAVQREELNGYESELLNRLFRAAFNVQKEVSSQAGDLLVERGKKISERERKLKDRGKASEERRDLERLRMHTWAALCAREDAIWKWQARSLRLLVLRCHCDRQYAGKALHPADTLKLPPEHKALAKIYDEQVTDTIRRLGGSMNLIKEQMDSEERMLLRAADWLVIKGPDLGAKVADALLDDLTRWMSNLPATRATVQEQVRRAAGLPDGKDRLESLGRNEQHRIERRMVRTFKEIRLDFDQDTLYRVRQDFEVLEGLLKNYPPRGLVTAAAPSWPGEPKQRLRLTDCRNLRPEVAARAYLRLFEQLEQDWDAVSAERAKYLVQINLKISYHNRAGAKKK